MPFNLHQINWHLPKGVKLVITNVWFLALFIALPICLLLPIRSQPYELKLESQTKTSSGYLARLYYDDMDHDGYSEKIMLFRNQLGGVAVLYTDHNGIRFNQWNYPTEYNSRTYSLFFNDVNGDGLKEIFHIYRNQDSVFLGVFTPNGQGTFINPRRFVTLVDKRADMPTPDLTVRDEFGTFFDQNGDGFNEFVFVIEPAYSRNPHFIVGYNLQNDTLIFSEKFESCIQDFSLADWDLDGEIEFTGGSGAGYNMLMDSKGILPDTCAWFLVFDKNFKIENEPFPLCGLSAAFYPVFNNNPVDPAFVGIALGGGTVDNQPVIFKYNKAEGMSFRDTLLFRGNTRAMFWSKPGRNGEFVFFDVNGRICWYTRDLKRERKLDLPLQAYAGLYPFASDFADAAWICCQVLKGGFLLVHNQRIYSASCPNDMKQTWFYQEIKYRGKPSRISWQVDNSEFIYAFEKNPFYYLRLPIYAGIYLLSALFVFLLFRIQKRAEANRYEQKQEILTLQLKTIKGQLDPHFTLNALNTLTSLTQAGNPEDASDFLFHFSRILNKQLHWSNEITVSLKDELEFVEHYARIQQFRFEEKIEYVQDIDAEVDLLMKIPKSAIHTFVENAIRHGVRPRGGGIVGVKISNQNSFLSIIIEDNGIGREKAKQLHTMGTGNGLKIVQQIFLLYEQLTKIRIEFSITDKTDENGLPSGTRVEIKIPGR